MSRRPALIKKIEVLEDVTDAIGKWVRYHSWTEKNKFLIKSVDLMNRKIIGIYVIDSKEMPNTTFNLCSGISTKRMLDYWYLIDSPRVDFFLDDKLFEI